MTPIYTVLRVLCAVPVLHMLLAVFRGDPLDAARTALVTLAVVKFTDLYYDPAYSPTPVATKEDACKTANGSEG